MKKIYLLFSGVILAIFLLSYNSNPPNGYTGAPGEATCSNCHSGSTSIAGDVEILGLPTSINPGQTYNITLKINNNSSPLTLAVRGGFQLVALDQNNNNIGTLSNPSSSSTIMTQSGRTYWEHNPAKLFSGMNNLTWTVDWTSPSTSQGQVVSMYAAANLANGNNNSSGDKIVSTDVSGTMPGPPPLSASISAFKNVSCFGGMDGTITVTASNGVPPYNYAWSNGQTTATATGLSVGTHYVTVTDQIGGTQVLNKALTQPSIIAVNGAGRLILNCAGDINGSINLNVTGGVGPYSYSWSNGAKTKDVSGLRAGDYSVTVKDNNLCEQTQFFTITQPDPITLSPLINKYPDCIKAETGEIEILPSGGIPSYTFRWNSGETSSLISRKKSSNYSVTVTDRNNCTKSISVTLLVRDTVPLKISKPDHIKWYLDSLGFGPDILPFIKSKVSDNCDTGIVVQLNKNTFNCSDSLFYLLNVAAIDLAGNKDSVTIDMRIIDTIKPWANLWSDSVSFDCNILVPKFEFYDNCGIRDVKLINGLKDGEIFPVGKTTMKFEIMDHFGNINTLGFDMEIKNPFNLKVDSIIYDRCTGKDPDVSISYSHFLNKSTGIFLLDSLVDQSDSFKIIHFTNVRDSQIILVLRDSSMCEFRDTTIFKYPDAKIILKDAIVKDASSCQIADGSISLNFIGTIHKMDFIDESGNKLSDQTGMNLFPGKYYVRCWDKPEEDSLACLFNFGPFIVSCVSSHSDVKNMEGKVEVYPNPSASGGFQLKINGDDPVHLKILNSQLKQLLSIKDLRSGQFQVELSEATPGIYFLVFELSNSIFIKKWILIN